MTQKTNKIPVAICYDFDGTLAPGNMQEHSYIPELGITSTDFWTEVKSLAKANDMNEILAYMYLMLEMAKNKNHPVHRNNFTEHGEKIQLFQGVDTWFSRINDIGKSMNLDIKHFIISSGLREMIEGTSIIKNFTYVFASGYYYDVNGVAVWPAVSIDYTEKTQFLFRINKGILNTWDNTKINKYTPESERPYSFSRIIYLGDGETDIPAMKMINYQGGYSIAVYDPNKRKTKNKKSPREISQELLKHDRTKFVAAADYNAGKGLDVLVQNILKDIYYNQILERHNHKYKPQ